MTVLAVSSLASMLKKAGLTPEERAFIFLAMDLVKSERAREKLMKHPASCRFCILQEAVKKLFRCGFISPR